jgi:succinate dehydrogenase/fumarate reductase cytochrome b subunit
MHKSTLGFIIVVCLTLFSLIMWISIEMSDCYANYITYKTYVSKYQKVIGTFTTISLVFLILLCVCLCIAFGLLYKAIKLNNVKIEEEKRSSSASFLSINLENETEEEKEVLVMPEVQQKKFKCVFIMFSISYFLRTAY